MKRASVLLLALLLLLAPAVPAGAQEGGGEKGEKSKLNPDTFAGLKLRCIGPALMSGRISDIAIDQTNPSTWYVAVGSGNVWKTTNSGITWKLSI